MKRQERILWGSHPSYSNGTPLKLERYTQAAMKQREREGWQCEACFPGESPETLGPVYDSKLEPAP